MKPKTKIHVLISNVFSPNENAFIAPLCRHQKQLQQEGVHLKIFQNPEKFLSNCNILFISSKFFKEWWTRYGFERIENFLVKSKKQADKVFWFDLSDSTGTTHFKVLPFVDKYLKNQILKDKTLYQKKYYGERLTTDYYHRTFDIIDTAPETPHLNCPPASKDLDKIAISWNSGLACYGRYRNYLEKLSWKQHQLHRILKPYFYSPLKKRSLPCSGRIGSSYSRDTVSIPRQWIKEKLALMIPMNKISMSQYFREMRTSYACLSPFGLGEISLRDFEIVSSGATIIKQNMDHLETWPNLWKTGETYLDFAWDLSDLNKKIDYAKSYPKVMQEVAATAQETYRKAFQGLQEPDSFLNHFLQLIEK